jgi:hypothetical protein
MSTQAIGTAITSERGSFMAQSTLHQTGESKPGVGKGHGTGALGPSDSSDSGSDIVGNRGLNHDDGLPLARGTTSDPDEDAGRATAGPDVGDADLDSDSDRYGTGERAAAGRDSAQPVDQTFAEHDAEEIESDDQPESEVETAEGLVADDEAAGASAPARSR